MKVEIEEELIYSPEKKEIEYFLKGPIPLDWLSKAAKLPGKTLNVAILCWFFHSLNKGKGGFKIQHKFIRYFKIHRGCLYRALKHLEDAKLIEVKRATGKISLVSILHDSEKYRG